MIALKEVTYFCFLSLKKLDLLNMSKRAQSMNLEICSSVKPEFLSWWLVNSFGAIGDYSQPAGRQLLSTLDDITLCNYVIKTAAMSV